MEIDAILTCFQRKVHL